jgi:hypothetical protein
MRIEIEATTATTAITLQSEVKSFIVNLQIGFEDVHTIAVSWYEINTETIYNTKKLTYFADKLIKHSVSLSKQGSLSSEDDARHGCGVRALAGEIT